MRGEPRRLRSPPQEDGGAQMCAAQRALNLPLGGRLFAAAHCGYPPASGVCERGRSSVVERQLPKLYVEGSIPFARSKSWQKFVPRRRDRPLANRGEKSRGWQTATIT